MKKLLIIASFILMSCFTASAQIYVGVDLGYGLYTATNTKLSQYAVENEWKPSNMNVTLNFGRSYSLLRTELATMLTLAAEADDDSGNTIEYSNYNVMINLYLDIPVSETVKIYPVLGIGLASSKANFTVSPKANEITGKSSLTFAWQAGLGASYQLNEQHSLDFTVRYLDLGEPDYETHYHGWAPEGNTIIVEGKDFIQVETSAIKLDLGYKYWF
ncbi:MAG: outer membrane beta-barrel protein [Deferribacteraceae bacterium]|nr:outer membrane beta-barrel protein [Deferribacteraceae bacterium]